jgi:hypothetical protein
MAGTSAIAGGTADGGGRLLVYLPGSTRPPDGGYEVAEDLDLVALLESSPTTTSWPPWSGTAGVDPGVLGAAREGGEAVSVASEAAGWLTDHLTPSAAPTTRGR